ncbi:hypothetical protein [Cylindrospermopsis raciborskii]|nr:hypothetical protein [Cylindrospermopsis raciborskii]
MLAKNHLSKQHRRQLLKVGKGDRKPIQGNAIAFCFYLVRI